MTSGKCSWLPFPLSLSCSAYRVLGLTWMGSLGEGSLGGDVTLPWMIDDGDRSSVPHKTAGGSKESVAKSTKTPERATIS